MSELAAALRLIFERNQDDFQRRLAMLERAVAAILGAGLDERLRASAEHEAHALAGSLGMFGLARESELALDIEHRLARPLRSKADDRALLADRVGALRVALDSQPAGARLIELAAPTPRHVRGPA